MKREDVKQFNGEDGKPAYIIYKNKVYDVTESRFWKKGKHMGRHKAGEDLTDFISMAPHDDKVLEKVKFVCELEDEIKAEDKKDRLRAFYRKYHPHPIFIHYPMGILYFGAFMLFLYLIFGKESFELASYYALIIGGLSIFPAVLSGVLSWYINYDMTPTEIFKNKIVYSVVLVVLFIVATILRISVGNLTGGNILYYMYVIVYFLMIPVMTFIAYNGGRITWPD
ncbi:MAG: cytochrome b5 [Calditerrivibrio sp.]|nr:cytochrome b5 [Calditerrivibrio sp.]